MPDLFEPIRVGRTTAANRIVVAPCIRHRARVDGVATPVMATYYTQRATAE
ncbi:MAG TPA: hypothetical protein VJ870_19160 [Amycolatopsis sp.]|nr:hypothetical protein [Amycolatopsis sp.]